MFSEKIHCIYQKELSKNKSFDSWGLPEKGMGIHRMLINGDSDEDYLVKALSELNVSAKWLIFADNEESDDFKRCQLTLLQRWRLSREGVTGVGEDLFFLITNDLMDFHFILDGPLWGQGVGIAFPSDSWNESKINIAINTQVSVKHNLIPAITNIFHCAIVAHNDGDGFNVLWDDNYIFASQIEEWAKESIKKYQSEFHK